MKRLSIVASGLLGVGAMLAVSAPAWAHVVISAPLSLRKSLRLTALVALGICSSFHLRSPQETRRVRVGR